MPVEIIAEVAQGYEGNPTLAKLLARGAVRAGADAVKFQLVYADDIATRDYQYYDLFRSLEMPREAWRAAAEEARAGGARFYLDVFGERSLEEAIKLGADGVKIHTTDFFNARLVRAALDAAPRVFISLGGISVEELEEFLALHRIAPSRQVCLMYGFQADPTPIEHNNLRRLGTLRARFPGYKLGFMDHSEGSSDEALTLAALVLPYGLDCIEKHISLDRSLQLEDYVSALSPEQFRVFRDRVRRLEQALGTDSLEVTQLEQEYRRRAMKVVVASRQLKKGEVAGAEALRLKRAPRPGPSSLHRVEQVAGRTVAVEVQPDQPITEEMLA
ncbi:MAG: N-acetylneuraminate synthase family protein [Chloroflexi bacterium]|nr:N-acetylneuraminate synthase family protein [Chloroflexota bacterium]